jgi:hypothetical protein
MNVDNIEWLDQDQAIERERVHYVSGVVERWEALVRTSLDRFARERWPTKYLLGLLSAKDYRLCSQRLGPITHAWWVEHEMPLIEQQPVVATYRVQLELDAIGQPTLTVQSGSGAYPVYPVSSQALEGTLAQAKRDIPLIVPQVSFQKPGGLGPVS